MVAGHACGVFELDFLLTDEDVVDVPAFRANDEVTHHSEAETHCLSGQTAQVCSGFDETAAATCKCRTSGNSCARIRVDAAVVTVERDERPKVVPVGAAVS